MPVISDKHAICGNPSSGTVQIGGACFGNDGLCASFFCEPRAGTCSVFCNAESQCGAMAACVRNMYGSTWEPDVCMKRCQVNGDCPSNTVGEKTCSVARDYISNTAILVCDSLGVKAGTSGVKGFGAIVGAGDGCDTNLIVSDSGGTLYCSHACKGNGDCVAPLSKCSQGAFANPDGIGTTVLTVCTP
jgi:hypothetical protein